jgi:DNA-binding CsgD family transcriptional regulator/uncharacterized protein YbjQ (UPF0145 family)
MFSVPDAPPDLAQPHETDALRGRRRECDALDRLLTAVRRGDSAALVVRGESGIGKTALLEHAVERAPDFRVERAAGLESETELEFAGLHQLCSEMLDRLERLPVPRRDALATAFGLTAGDAPHRLFVALAVQGLLAEAAAERPLLCVIDDAQWLDGVSAQVLAIVARRLQAESIALLIAVREPRKELAGLPELVIGGLPPDDARELLAAAIPGPLDERVRDRIAAETRGNPRALELSRAFHPAELAGGFGLPVRRWGAVGDDCLRRLAQLPAATQRLLLLAAAEPLGEPVLLWRAAAQLGIGPDAAAPAESEKLLQLGARVRFEHPLARAAVYGEATREDRRTVHSALAEATGPDADPEWYAWHRALAVCGTDEEIADELEHAAYRVQSRGGTAAAAAFLEQAAELTPGEARRAGRAIAAAGAKLDAGAPERAGELLASIAEAALDEKQRAHLELGRARVASAERRSNAPALLLAAAKRLEPVDPQLARVTHGEALEAALTGPDAVGEVAEAARHAPPPVGAVHPFDLLLDGMALLLTDGYAAGAPLLKRALEELRSESAFRHEQHLHRLGLAVHAAFALWDDESANVLATRRVQVARNAGALAVLPSALAQLAVLRVQAGELAEGAALLDEENAVARAIGGGRVDRSALVLAAWRDEALTHELAAAADNGADAVADYAIAVLENGTGRRSAALAAARRAVEHDLPGLSAWALPELVEAAVRSGKPQVAQAALERLSEGTRASGTQLALGIEARARALLADGGVADRLYRESIVRLGRCRAGAQLARAHLLYGEWLARNDRRGDARTQLRTARDLFATMGADVFMRWAAYELQAAGESAKARAVARDRELTAQETRIAALARDGLTNREIGVELSISPRTVEYHLHKVFSKLAIRSRNQLRLALPDTAEAQTSQSPDLPLTAAGTQS